MENAYDVGIGNRYALFLEEGDNSLTAIKKKLSKELRAKNKLIKKENAEAKKVEVTKTPEKPKKPVEPKTATSEVTPPKKEAKEKKNEAAKDKEKKPNENNTSKKEKGDQDKNRNLKPNDNVSVENEKEKENNKSNEFSGNARVGNFEGRKNRGKKFENDQPKATSPTNKKFNKEEATDKDGNADNVFERYQNDDNRNIKENGHGPHNDFKPRGGRYGKGTRGGRNNQGGGDRKKEFEQATENKDEWDTNKNESNEEEPAEFNAEKAENKKDEEKPTEADADETAEQKEVKEYITLDEWKKLRGTRQKPQYNLRKAGEGEDLTQWKNMRELHKKKDDEFLKNGTAAGTQSTENIENHEEIAQPTENVQRVARQKHIDINVHFKDAPSRGRGGRSSRGGGGGGGGRFGYKGNFDHNDSYGGESRSFRKNRDSQPGGGRGVPRQNAPKVNDERDFPSLG